MKKRLFFTLVTSIALFCASCSETFEELNIQTVKNKSSNEYIQLNDGSYAQKTPYGYVVEGDILLSDSIIDYLTSPKTRGAYAKNITYWPSGVIYYKINSNISNRSVITDAIAVFEQNTHLRFEEANSHTSHYVEFIRGNALCSTLGMTSGERQYIYVTGDATYSEVIHEIGHTIGLVHEHTRPDRDDYIIVNTSNIASGKEEQFAKKASSEVGISREKYPFDFNSIMLYSSYVDSTLAINPDIPVITRKNGGLISKNLDLSEEDIITINTAYPIQFPITGTEYCLLPEHGFYHASDRFPANSTFSWFVYPSSSGTVISGQGTRNIEVEFTNSQVQHIGLHVTYDNITTVSFEFHVQASYVPIVSDINMFKYTSENGIYTLQAISTDKNANCSWSYEMSPILPSTNEPAELRDISYPMDAMFIESPNLFKEILFYNTGICNITVQASNNYGTSSFTKSNIYIHETVGSVGFTLAPNPIVNGDETLLTILDKERNINTYKISIYQNNTLVKSWETHNLSNPINVNGLSDGEYLLVVEKENCKSEQILTINKQS